MRAPREPMPFDTARRIYLSVFPDAQHSPSEWEDVHAEMQQVVDASSDRRAAEVIRWWGCWSRELSCLRAARELRAAYRRLA